MTRGVVLGFTLEQVAARAELLGSPTFLTGYYRLGNGGKDPTAADPFDRSYVDEHKVEHQGVILADCIGGAAWDGGWDRYQPVRFAHIYDGWINTDSMIMDAAGPAKCFRLLPRPVRGCYLVAPTGAPGFENCGHITTITYVPPDFSFDSHKSWEEMLGVDVSLRGAHRANLKHDGTWWYAARNHGARFIVSTMTP